MVYDRTAADVDNAKKIRTEKIQKGISLTADDVSTLEKGSITINTLNRIENKQAELKQTLADMGYYSGIVNNKTWTYNDIFFASDLQRICDNTIALRAAFEAMADSPLNPIPKYYYSEINAIEKILYDIAQNITQTTAKYRRCNTFNCGE